MDGNFNIALNDYRADLPLAEKWNRLKPAITRLYVEENRKLEEVQDIIRRQCGFDAGIHQLKYHIRRWKLKKSIPASAKTKMLEIKELRASMGKETAFEYNGKPVDNKKLDRLAKALANETPGRRRKEAAKLKIAPRIFIIWTMPYGALRHSQTGPFTHVSPNIVGSTPAGDSDIVVRTPGMPGPPSPAADSLSGISRVLGKEKILERAHMFLEGKHDQLLLSMDTSEQITMSTWLYQFWFFAYQTAKHWGRGPRDWTPDLLELDKYAEKPAISPGSPATSPDAAQHHIPVSQWFTHNITPGILCDWGFCIPVSRDERMRDGGPDGDSDDDPHDDWEWKDWPKDWRRDSFVKKLGRALTHNLFSNIDIDDLPIALPRILMNSDGFKDQLLQEGLAFSIMGRNVDLMFSLVRKIKRRRVNVEGLFPFHLATSYICGSNPLRNAFGGLIYHPKTFPIRAMYVNDRGHTVLDNLMVAIVKAHTSCVPGDVDEQMKGQRRFAGEEVDICGRWDAESDEMRALLAKRSSKIPCDWRHKFCHTSAQAICHYISLMFGPHWKPDIDHPSGLFKKNCQHCTQGFTLLPLHTLIMVAFLLAEQGCTQEDLFGVTACLICLLSKGANPLLSSTVSAAVMYGTDQSLRCTHETLTPFQLVERLPQHFLQRWTPALRTGWILLGHVLRLSEKAWLPDPAQPTTSTALDFEYFITYPEDHDDLYTANWMYIDTGMDAMDINRDPVDDDDGVDEYIRCGYNCGRLNYFRGSHQLRDLWSAIQAEMFMYRGLRHSHGWISQNFNMNEVVRSLEDGYSVRAGLNERLFHWCFEHGICFSIGNGAHVCIDEFCHEYASKWESRKPRALMYYPEKWRHSVEAENDESSNDSGPDDSDEEDIDDDDF